LPDISTKKARTKSEDRETNTNMADQQVSSAVDPHVETIAEEETIQEQVAYARNLHPNDANALRQEAKINALQAALDHAAAIKELTETLLHERLEHVAEIQELKDKLHNSTTQLQSAHQTQLAKFKADLGLEHAPQDQKSRKYTHSCSSESEPEAAVPAVASNVVQRTGPESRRGAKEAVPSRTPKKSAKKAKAKPVSESEESEAEVDVREEEVEVSVTPAKKKTPTKKKSATKAAKAAAAPAAAAHADKEVSGTTIVCGFIYLQLFAAGLGAIYGPFEVMKLAYGDSIEPSKHPYVAKYAGCWLFAFILQLPVAMTTGAEGSHAQQKRMLRYLIFLPLMLIAMVVSHVDVMRPEFLNGVVAVSMLNLGLLIWGGYITTSTATTKLLCDLMQWQVFAAGLGAGCRPLEVMKLAYGDSIESNELAMYTQRWLGVFILQLLFTVIDGAQSNHADQTKTLGGLMFLPLMSIIIVVADEVTRPEFRNGVVSVSLLDLGLMIWASYYSKCH
jgi:hypothetical protein